MTLPKAELHLHIEGTLEPEQMFAFAKRNKIALRYTTVDEVKAAYQFNDLQSFLDVYYEACAVLVTEDDFYELTMAYLRKAQTQGVRHAEIFVDPQTHTERGIYIGIVIEGIARALADGQTQFGITSRLIICLLRHLPPDLAMQTVRDALPYRKYIVAVGLDSGEAGSPPEHFQGVFDYAISQGFRTVAHAGEEGPPEYIWQALDLLEVDRIDHGVRCLEDTRLVDRLVGEQLPLTVCPLSNVKLRVVDKLENHPLKTMLERGLLVTVNSDDPAYFGGYVGDNFAAVAAALQLSDAQLVQLARNSFTASFLEQYEKVAHLRELDSIPATS